MLGHRLRRWPNIESVLGERVYWSVNIDPYIHEITTIAH